MDEVNLLVMCANAFFAVLVLLSILALAMRLLTTAFPPARPTSTDPAWAAAIQGAVATIYSGARVTHIHEIGGEKK